jgi:phosphomannomutase
MFSSHFDSSATGSAPRLLLYDDVGLGSMRALKLQVLLRAGILQIKRTRHIACLSSGLFQMQILPVSKSSQMITFTLENSCIITMRTSGTEPKIKYYTEFCSRPEMGLVRPLRF